MKKIFALLCAFTLLLCSCSVQPAPSPSESDELDLSAIDKRIAALTDGQDKPLFGGLYQPAKEELEEVYGLDLSLIEEYSVGISGGTDGLYMLLLPKEGLENELKNNVASVIEQCGKQNELYSPEQFAMIEERTETFRGDYLIYLISRDNQKVLDAIDAAE